MRDFYFPFALPLIVLILTWHLFAMPALAQWSTDPNVNNAICTAADHQIAPTITSDGAGGAIITWVDDRNRSGTGRDIYAQKINAAGVVQWTPDGVAICTAVGPQNYPTITSDGAGGAIITWQDYRSGNSDIYGDIYAQRINAAGVVQWTVNGIAVSTATNAQEYPAITSDGAGGAIITWQDYRSGTNFDIYAQRINSAGVVQWTTNSAAISTAADNQRRPTITSDGSGGAIITWDDYRSGTNLDIYAQRINSAGMVQWTTDGVAISTAAGGQGVPKIVSDGAGGAIITWWDGRSGLNIYLDIYAQRINAAGVVQWTANGVAISTAAGSQDAPTIVSDRAAGAIITWYDGRSGTSYDIYAQRINAAGVVQWEPDGIAISTEAGNQLYPTITSDGAGGAIITWADERRYLNWDIYAQKINAAGVVQWTANGVAISTAPSGQYNPTITSDGAAGAIITWGDGRSGLDIYAQQVSTNGQLGVVTEVQNDVPPLPESFRLEQNYPNPFNPSTTIVFSLPRAVYVTLKVFNILGQEVAILLSQELAAGTYQTKWDATTIGSGTYFYRLHAGTFIETKKLIFLK